MMINTRSQEFAIWNLAYANVSALSSRISAKVSTQISTEFYTLIERHQPLFFAFRNLPYSLRSIRSLVRAIGVWFVFTKTVASKRFSEQLCIFNEATQWA